ncbi:MAG TPA: hypothetical protein VJJ55_00305 [Candidatus Paceibacterota bacterium]
MSNVYSSKRGKRNAPHWWRHSLRAADNNGREDPVSRVQTGSDTFVSGLTIISERAKVAQNKQVASVPTARRNL